MSINIMLEMCFWSWKTDIVNKETLVNEEKSKDFLARQLGSFTMKITVPFFLAEIAIGRLVLRIIYTSSMYFF